MSAPESSSDRHRSTMASSHSEAPTSWPMAFRKVKHMAPPTTRVSTTSSRASIGPSLSDTFEPPSTATNGRLSGLRRLISTSASRASRRPAAEGRNRGGPMMEAWGRCETPKASFT